MLPVFGQFLGNIISNTYDLMNSFFVPGTLVTPWGFFMWIVRLSLVFFALKTLFGWEIGYWGSKYREMRSKPSSTDSKKSPGGFNHKGLPPSSKRFTRR